MYNLENTCILKMNKHKWKTLPAGGGRQTIDYFMSLNDNELLKIYNKSIAFWKKERGWEYEKYSKLFTGASVLEIGSGLGYDGITFSKKVNKWTFCDIISNNIEFIKRIAHLFKINNVDFQVIEDIFNHDYLGLFDGLYAHGVLHHVPFEIAKKEVANIDQYLKSGARVVLLMYPIERWEICGKPSFSNFGKMTDGEGTPWAEYYDERKIVNLFGPEYVLENTTKWGHESSEFVNFELQKR